MDLLIIMTTITGVGAGMISMPVDSWINRHPTHTKLAAGTSRITFSSRFLVGMISREMAHSIGMGITPVAVASSTILTFRVTAYNYANRNQLISTPEGEPILYKATIFVGLTGLISEMVLNPHNLVRTRMYSFIACKSDVCRMFRADNQMKMFTHLMRNHGLRVFFLGTPACIPRGFIASSVQLFTYFLLKEYFEETDTFDTDVGKRVTSSVLSSALSCLCAAPFDLTLARLHNQPLYCSGRGLMYDGVADCVQKTYSTEGIHVFYRGALVMIMKVCPGTALSLLIWDTLTQRSSLSDFLEHIGDIGIF